MKIHRTLLSINPITQAQILARKGKAAGEAAAAEPAVATQQADQPASAKAYKCHASQKEKLKAESAAAQVISKEDSKAAAVCVAPISDAATAGAAGQAAPTLTIGAARACPTDAVKAAPSCAASSQAMASVGPAARDQGAPTADADDEAESAAPHTLGRNGNAHAGAPKSNVTPIKRPLIAALSGGFTAALGVKAAWAACLYTWTCCSCVHAAALETCAQGTQYRPHEDFMELTRCHVCSLGGSRYSAAEDESPASRWDPQTGGCWAAWHAVLLQTAAHLIGLKTQCSQDFGSTEFDYRACGTL